MSATARHVRFWFENPANDPVLGYLSEVELLGTTAIQGAAAESPTETPVPATPTETPVPSPEVVGTPV